MHKEKGRALKIKDPRIFFILIPFVATVGVIEHLNKITPLEFEADGKVSEVNWNGPNHGLPFLVIEQNEPAGMKRKLESNDIALTSEQIKVGDKFIKHSGSKLCKINGIQLTCIK